MNTLLRFTFALSISLGVAAPVFAQDSEPTFPNPCECVGCHGVYRWDAKTQNTASPSSVELKLKPSDIGAWAGPGGDFHQDTPRTPSEERWIEVTGKVTLVKVETDGDLHIQLVDEGAADDSVNLVVEVPDGEPWCDIRKEVLGWTGQKFPFSTKGKKFHLQGNPVITVVGMAFYDAMHGGGDPTANRRHAPPNATAVTKQVTIREIHPVMKLVVKTQ